MCAHLLHFEVMQRKLHEVTGIFGTPAAVTWLFTLILNANHALSKKNMGFCYFIFIHSEPVIQYFSTVPYIILLYCLLSWDITRVVLIVMSNFFLQANWEQQTKESTVVDGTSCCVILEFL